MSATRKLGMVPRIVIATAGSLFWISGVILYATTKSSTIPLILWVVALGAFCVSLTILKKSRGHERTLDRKDVVVALILLAVFSPIYLVNLHDIPWQVNTDEVTIMLFSEKIASLPNADPVGISDYLGFPTLPFYVFGKLTNFLGGMSLEHMRLVHALSGLFIIVVAYLFFRAFSGKGFSATAAAILGASHSLIAISRMAMRDNTGLLIELAALALLSWGLVRRSTLLTFLGGIAAGLTFYTYYPSRITLIIWGAFLGVALMVLAYRISRTTAIRFGFLTLAGFIFIVTPLGVATVQSPASNLHYPSQQFLFLPAGQELQVQWSGGLPIKEAVQKNIMQGLQTFNAPIHDHGYIYPNHGHGFVDPVTGVLIWIGLASAFLRIKSRERGVEADLLAIIGFLILYLAFSFLITKAPNYTRLLVTLPFVAYLATLAIFEMPSLVIASIRKISPALRIYIGRVIAVGIVTVIIVLNLQIFGDFAIKGFAEGNDVGGTARYVEDRSHVSDYSFYLAADKNFPYYSWGSEYQWKDWLGFFAPSLENVHTLKPFEVATYEPRIPFTMFFSEPLWENMESDMRAKYPHLTVHPILPNGRLMAIEVLR